MKDSEFVDAIRLAQGFWNQEWPADTLDIWSGQMRTWDYRLLELAIRSLARELKFLPKFSEIAEAYRIEKVKDRPTSSWPAETRGDPALRDRWTRVIAQQLKSFGHIGAPPSPIGQAVKRHYRRDGGTIVVMDGAKMLRDAEEAMSADAFGG